MSLEVMTGRKRKEKKRTGYEKLNMTKGKREPKFAKIEKTNRDLETKSEIAAFAGGSKEICGAMGCDVAFCGW